MISGKIVSSLMLLIFVDVETSVEPYNYCQHHRFSMNLGKVSPRNRVSSTSAPCWEPRPGVPWPTVTTVSPLKTRLKSRHRGNTCKNASTEKHPEIKNHGVMLMFLHHLSPKCCNVCHSVPDRHSIHKNVTSHNKTGWGTSVTRCGRVRVIFRENVMQSDSEVSDPCSQNTTATLHVTMWQLP